MSDELKRQQAMEGLGRIVKVIEYPYCTCPDSSSFGHEPGCPILTANVAVREAIEAAWQDVREKIISFESFYKAMQPHFTAAVRAAVKERGGDTKLLAKYKAWPDKATTQLCGDEPRRSFSTHQRVGGAEDDSLQQQSGGKS